MAAAAATGGSFAAGNRNIAKNSRIRSSLQLGAPGEHVTIESAFCNRMVEDFDKLNADKNKGKDSGGTPETRKQALDELDDQRHAIRRALIHGAGDSFSSSDNIYNEYNMPAITTAAYLLGSIGLCNPETSSYADLRGVLWPPLATVPQDAPGTAYWKNFLHMFYNCTDVQLLANTAMGLGPVFAWHTNAIAVGTFAIMYKYYFLRTKGLIDTKQNRAKFMEYYWSLQRGLNTVFGHGAFFDVAPGPAAELNSMSSLTHVARFISRNDTVKLGIYSTELWATVNTVEYIKRCKAAIGGTAATSTPAFEAVVASAAEAGLLAKGDGDEDGIVNILTAQQLSARKRAHEFGLSETDAMEDVSAEPSSADVAVANTYSTTKPVDAIKGADAIGAAAAEDLAAAATGGESSVNHGGKGKGKDKVKIAAAAAAAANGHPNTEGVQLKEDILRFTPRPVYDYLRFSHLLTGSSDPVERDAFMADCAGTNILPACHRAEEEDAAYWKYHYDICARLFGWSKGKLPLQGSMSKLANAWSKHDGTGLINEFGALLWSIRMASAVVDLVADFTPAGMYKRFLGANGSCVPDSHIRIPAVSFGHVPLHKYVDVIDGTDAYAEETNDDRAKLVPAIVRNMYRMSGDAEDLVSLIAKVHPEGKGGEEGITGAIDWSYDTGGLGGLMLRTFAKRLLVDTVAGQLLGLPGNLASAAPAVASLCADEYSAEKAPLPLAAYRDKVKRLLAPDAGNKPISPQLHAELLENLTVGAFTDTASTAFSVLAEVAAGCKTMNVNPFMERLYLHEDSIAWFLDEYKPPAGSPYWIRNHVARLTRGIGSVARFSIPLKLAIIQDFLMDEATAGRVGEGELTFNDSVAVISKYLAETVPSDDAGYLEKPAHRLWALKRVWDVLFPPSGKAPPPWKVLACVEQFGHFRGDSPMVVLGPAVANIVTQRCVYRVKNTSATDRPSIPTRSGLASSGDGAPRLRDTYAMYECLCYTDAAEKTTKAWNTRGYGMVAVYTERLHTSALALTGQVPGIYGNHVHHHALAYSMEGDIAPQNTSITLKDTKTDAGVDVTVPTYLAGFFNAGAPYPNVPPTADIMRAIVEYFPRATMYPKLHDLPYTLASLLARVNTAGGEKTGARGAAASEAFPPLVYSSGDPSFPSWGGLFRQASGEAKEAAERAAPCPVGQPSEIIATSNAATLAYFVHARRTADISGIGDVVPASLTGAGELWVETTLRSSTFGDRESILARVESYRHQRVVRARAVFEEGGAYDRAMVPVKKELLRALEDQVRATVAEYTSALNAFHQDPAYAVWRDIRDRVYGSDYRDDPIAAVAGDFSPSSTPSPGLNQVYGPVRAAVAAAATRINQMFEAPPGTDDKEKYNYGKSTACTTNPADKASGFVQQKFVGAHMSPAQPSPGLLLWHSAGSGKTICGVNAVNNFIYGPPGGSRNGSPPAATWNVIWVVPDAIARQQLIVDMFKYADRRRVEDGLPDLADDVNEAEREFGNRFRDRWRKNATISAAAIAAGALYSGTAGEEDDGGGGATPKKIGKRGTGAAAGAKNGPSGELNWWRTDKELDGADVAAKLVLTYADFAKFVNGVYAERQDPKNSSGSGYPDKIAAEYYLASEAYYNDGTEITDVLRETLLVFDEFQNVFAEGAGGAHAGSLTPEFRVRFMSLLNESRAKSGPLACKLLAFSATPEGTHMEMAIPGVLDEEYAGTKDTLARMLQIIRGPVMEMIPPKAGEGGKPRYRQINPIEADASKPLVPENRKELVARFPRGDGFVAGIMGNKKRAGGGREEEKEVDKRLREEFIRRYITPCVSYFDSSGSPLLMPQIRYKHEPVALLGPMSSFVMVDAIDATGVAIEAFASILRGSSGLTRTAMFSPELRNKLEGLVPNVGAKKRIAAYARLNVAK